MARLSCESSHRPRTSMRNLTPRQRSKIVLAFQHGETIKTLAGVWMTSIAQIESIVREAITELSQKENA